MPSSAARPTVASRIHQQLGRLSPSERRVALLLLSGGPLAGLEPMATLATRAETSSPSVCRLLDKLGFAGYADFQAALKQDIAARLSSPAQLYPDGAADQDPMPATLDRLGHAVRDSAADLDADDVRRVLALLADPDRRVHLVGGRFSDVLAQHLAFHLRLLRPGVDVVPAGAEARAAALLDIDDHSLVVAFDYRRYQTDTVGFGRAADGQGATVVLCTDQYLSPLTTAAQVVLCSRVEAAPFHALTPAFALVEALVVGLVDRLGGTPRERVAAYDTLAAELGADHDPEANHG